MKKHLFALAAMALTYHIATAQTEKGNQTIGLNLGYSHATNNTVIPNPLPGYPQNESYTQTYINIGPQYSYFIANNLDLGIGLNYLHTTAESFYTTAYIKQKNDGYGANVYLRKYFLYDSKFGFRTGGLVGYSHSKEEYNGSSPFITPATTNQVYGNLMFDLVYYPSKKIGLAANLVNVGYSHSKTDNSNAGSQTSDAVNFNFINSGLTLSAFYTFGGK